MATIRQEINVIGGGIWTPSVAADSVDRAQLDVAQYSGSILCYLEVSYENVTAARTLTLRRVGTSTDDVTFTFGTAGTRTLARSGSFTPPAGATEYTVHVNGSGPVIYAARIIVIQTEAANPMTNTETQVQIGWASSTTSVTGVVPGRPTYWKYDSSVWDGTLTVFFEAMLKAGNTKSGATARLQVADGTGDGFVNWADVASSDCTTVVTANFVRVRSSAITLTAGRNYRCVFFTGTSKSAVFIDGAKIIIRSATFRRIEAQYQFNPFGISAGTALQGALVKWDSAEWVGVTDTYKSSADAGNGSTSVVELDTAAGTQLTGSSTGAIDNQNIVGPVTMPASGNLDFKATTNAGDVAFAKLLVQVLVGVSNPAFVNRPQFFKSRRRILQ